MQERKVLCYLQGITHPTNTSTTAHIVFGWCILGVNILGIYTGTVSIN